MLIRIYPDQIAVQTHEEELTQEEAEAARDFAAIFESGDIEEQKAAWRELARRYGAPRAAWLARQGAEYDGPVKDDDWTRAPRIRVLPDFFEVFIHSEDGAVVRVRGEPIRARVSDELPIMARPTEQTAAPTNTEPALFDDDSHWVVDFNAAEGIGMAIRLEDVPPGPLTIVAIGIRRSGDGPSLLEELIDDHHYGAGCGFLRHGTPTNNTRSARSGHSASGNHEAAFEAEFGGAAEPLPERSSASRLARALGLPTDSHALQHLQGGRETAESWTQELQRALWPATGDYAARRLLPDGAITEEALSLLHRHFERFVRARGPLPLMRVGNLPYGVLPVTRIQPSTEEDRDGWAASPHDSELLDGEPTRWQRFDAGLHRALQRIHPCWADAVADADRVPRVGGNDPDADLLLILAMQPKAVSYRLRPFVDDRFAAWLLDVLGQRLSLTQRIRWMEEWERKWHDQRRDGAAVLEALGVAESDLQEAPWLRMLTWGDGEPLRMPLVRDPRNPSDRPWSYLTTLCAQGADAHEEESDTLLFQLLRRSILLEERRGETHALDAVCDLAGPRVLEFLNRVMEPEAIVRRIRDDPDFGPPSPRAYGVRPSLARRILEVRDQLPGGRFTSIRELDAIRGVGPDTLHDILFSFAEGAPELEDLLRDALDPFGHRLDAWYTSLATKRLEAMRVRSPEGLHLGYYGYVEGLEPRATSASPDGGYVHAPSVAQASTAAILRNAFLSHKDVADGNPFFVDLTSERVRRALAILEGIRQGQDLGALLGFQFERGLHDRRLDALIDPFRSRFPVVAGRENRPEDAGAPQEPVEALAARNVVDGLTLARECVKTDDALEVLADSVLAEVAGAFPSGTDARVGLIEELRLLRDALDGVADLLMQEAVYQAVEGNYERSAAALDALSGEGVPPEIESIRTAIPGTGVGHRVCLLFDPGNDTASFPVGPRELAEPALAAWFDALLGDSAKIGCCVRFERELPGSGNGSGSSRREADARVVRLSDLEIGPLDFLYGSAVSSEGGASELELRIEAWLREQEPQLAPKGEIAIEMGRQETGTCRGVEPGYDRALGEAVELARRVLRLLGGASPLRPDALCVPDDADAVAFARTDLDAMLERCEVLRQHLFENVSERVDSTDEVESRAALRMASQYGISSALPPEPVTARVEAVRKEAERRQQVAMKEIQTADDIIESLPEEGGADPPRPERSAAAMRHLSGAVKALFGEAFVVLPTFTPPDGEGLRDAMADQDAVLAGHDSERILLWLQQAAETHPALRRLEDAWMLAEAWAPGEATAALQPHVVQLPLDDAQPWQALSDAELGQEESAQRPRGSLALTAIASGPIDPARVAGLLVDQWEEIIPSREATTGLSFHYDQPSTQPPQSLLLAVPSRVTRRAASWTEERLAAIVRDTMELAKVRTVDLDALRGVGAIFPALFLPGDPVQPGFDRPVTMRNLHEKIESLGGTPPGPGGSR